MLLKAILIKHYIVLFLRPCMRIGSITPPPLPWVSELGTPLPSYHLTPSRQIEHLLAELRSLLPFFAKLASYPLSKLHPNFPIAKLPFDAPLPQSSRQTAMLPPPLANLRFYPPPYPRVYLVQLCL